MASRTGRAKPSAMDGMSRKSEALYSSASDSSDGDSNIDEDAGYENDPVTPIAFSISLRL